MKYFLIMNPKSKGGKSKKKFDRIFSLLNQAKVDYEYTFVYTLEEAYQKSVEANKKSIFDIVVAVGGDGTINNVINGFYNKEGHRLSKAKFAVIYTGTSPDFCKSYGISIHTDEAVKTLLRAQSRSILIGKLLVAQIPPVERTNSDAKFKIQYFACCANIGIGASIARRANGGIRKYFGDYVGTFLSMLISIAKYKANTFKVCMDGKAIEIPKLYNLSVGITKYIASGIKVHNDKELHSASFYCLETKALNLRNTPSTLKRVYSGKQIKTSKTLALSYLNTIEVKANLQNPEVELDGDPIGYLPCSIDAAKDCLHLIC